MNTTTTLQLLTALRHERLTAARTGHNMGIGQLGLVEFDYYTKALAILARLDRDATFTFTDDELASFPSYADEDDEMLDWPDEAVAGFFAMDLGLV